jgi:hypothetical protein
MIQVVFGILSTCAILSGVYFLRFWHQTKDVFFLLFAIAFAVLGLQWIGLAFEPADHELRRTYFYVARLVAFIIILLAIGVKNREKG